MVRNKTYQMSMETYIQKLPQNVKDNTVYWKKFLKNDSFISDILLWSKIDSSFPKC